MSKFILFFITVSVLLWAEPSVYGNSNSYTNLQKSAKKNRSRVLTLEQDVEQLKLEVEGLKSIIEGLSQTLNKMERKAPKGNGSIGQRQMTQLQNTVDKIDRNYVSKSELKRVLKGEKILTPKKIKNSTKNSSKTKDNTLESAPSKALYSRGVRLVKQKRYSMAKLRFDILKKRGYKRASTHFYLGEIAYRTKQYGDAIELYKKSAEANEKANYMDTLLLHTGLALEKKGDRSQAKRFFQAIVDGYPDTGSAKVAKKHL